MLLWSNESDNKPNPRTGDFCIVTSFSGEAVCVIETTMIEILPFEEIGAEFAAIEGDGSLQHWRAVHEAFFSRECKRFGRSPDPRMPVVCERFEMVFAVTAG